MSLPQHIRVFLLRETSEMCHWKSIWVLSALLIAIYPSAGLTQTETSANLPAVQGCGGTVSNLVGLVGDSLLAGSGQAPQYYRNRAYQALSNNQPEKAIHCLYAAGDIEQAQALEDRLAGKQKQYSQPVYPSPYQGLKEPIQRYQSDQPITMDGVVYTPYNLHANEQTVYSASECVGAIVAGVCHGTILPKQATHPTCHGQMLNGSCTGPMF